MNRRRFSVLAHANHEYFGPIGSTLLFDLFPILDLQPDSRIFDLGCGIGTMLIQLVKASGGQGIGVDREPEFLDRGRAAAHKAGLESTRIEWIEQDGADYSGPASPVDLACCIGATGMLGGYDAALGRMREWVVPGGWLLLGEGYWRQPPSPEYLALLGAEADEMTTHEKTIVRGETLGLACRFVRTSTVEEWDAYEGLYSKTLLQYGELHADDPETPAYCTRILEWQEGYRRWGRDTLGFGIYLFQT